MATHRKDIVFGGVELECEYETDDGAMYLIAVRAGGIDITGIFEDGSPCWIAIEEALDEALKEDAICAAEDRAYGRWEEQRLVSAGLM